MRFLHTATVERMTASSGNFVYSAHVTSVCFLQPLDNESSEIFGQTFSKGSSCYFPIATDVKEKDRVTVDSITYGVKGVKIHNYGNLAHKKALLEQI